MYYNCTYANLAQFLKSPKAVKNLGVKDVNNLFATTLTRIKNPISLGSCEGWSNKKMLSKFRSNLSDQSRRQAFEKHELPNLVLKGFLTCAKSSQFEYAFNKTNFNFRSKLKSNHHALLGPRLVLISRVRRAFLAKHGSFSKIRNRCILTARNTVLNKFGLSRIMFRKLAGLGMIPGIIKSA